MDSLPVKPGRGAKPERGPQKPDVVKSLEAIIRGTLGKSCKVEDFPADPETACKRQHSFLTLWYQCTPMKKPDERKAFSLACPSMSQSECKQIVNSLHEYKSFLHRKLRNLKTGEKPEPVFKALFKAICKESSEGHSLRKAGSGSQSPIKLEKRLSGKTSPQCLKKLEKPVEAGNSSKSSGVIFDWGNAGNASQSPQTAGASSNAMDSEQEPAEASSNGMDSEQEPADAEEILSISSEDVILAADMDTEEEEEEIPVCKKPAKGNTVKKKLGMKKKPAKGNTVKKKPSCSSNLAWTVSPSFGLVKATTASEKAYLQAKNASGEKPYCLVNIGIPKGEKQSQIVAAVLGKCKEEGWDKSKLVAYKNSLLVESLEKAE